MYRVGEADLTSAGPTLPRRSEKGDGSLRYPGISVADSLHIDPDPDPHQNNVNLLLMVYKPSTAPF
jgi:hypothetical protein